MSIADKITQLTTIRGDIRTALAGKGVSASDHDFADFATDISSISTGGLPAEYEAVEYIESTGTQYIDTGYKPSKFTTTRLDHQMTYIDTSNNFLFGIDVSGSANNFYGAYIGSNNKVECRHPYQNGYGYFTAGTNRQTLTFGGGNYSLSDTIYSWALQAPNYDKYGNPNDFDNTAQLNEFIFCCNKTGTGNNFTRYKLYKCQIFNNGTGEMYRNFVPCKRKADDEAGLYDLVNGVFYTNQGTGSFIIPT